MGTGNSSNTVHTAGAKQRASRAKKTKAIKPPKNIKQVQFKLHIAIDFGTSGCGIAFSHNGKIQIYDKWRGQSTASNKKSKKYKKKTKTQLILNEKNEVMTFGNGAKFTYFHLSSKQKEAKKFFERFKMALYECNLSRPEIIEADDDDDEKKRDSLNTNIAKYLYSSNNQRVKAETVFTAAFKELQTTAKDHVKYMITEENITDEEIQWIVTVPAIWSEKAKDKMRKWIIKAGLVKTDILDQCIIVYEPDCASLSMQHEYFKALPRKQSIIFNPTDEMEDEEKVSNANKPTIRFEDGDKYILVDAGGGTVDIACHKIMSEGTVEELIYPTGDRWGSSYIDDLFITLLDDIFKGVNTNLMKRYKDASPSGYVEMIESFEQAKHAFYKKKTATTHRIELPDDFMIWLERQCDQSNTSPEEEIATYSNNNGEIQYFKAFFGVKDYSKWSEEGFNQVKCSIKYRKEREDSEDDDDSEDDQSEYIEYLEMDVSIWKCLFDSKINNIMSHVEDLLNRNSMKDCKFLGLVGGFSCSKYFQYKMKTHFGVKSGYHLITIIPSNPLLSVVKGAALMATNTDYIQARRIRHTYGVAMYFSEENARTRGISDQYIQNNKNVFGVKNCFKVIVRKGDRVSMNDVKTDSGFSLSRSSLIKILCSDQHNAKVVGDGKELATLSIEDIGIHTKVLWEFHFYGTMFQVFAYPESNPGNKKNVPIKYERNN